jgi:uncharacterized protein YecT (DUF1311 family)
MVGGLLLAPLVLVSTPQVSAAPTSVTTSTLAPPVIHEGFTLPCTRQQTTLGMEGCQQHRLVKLDKTIDQAERVLFTMLKNEAAVYGPSQGATYTTQVEQRLIDAQDAWFAYQLAECRSESDTFLGGSGAPLVAGDCRIKLDQQRLGQLKAFYLALRGHSKEKDPPFPRG